jgi:hypothetical protein
MPFIDQLAYNAMKTVSPWYFPSIPIQTPDGKRQREDLDWWKEQWFVEGGIEAEEIRLKSPWMKYWIECSRDCSMRNRKRIWGVAEQMRDLGLRKGILTPK